MKVKEIAASYNLSESNVKQRLFRARKTIIYLSKKELEKIMRETGVLELQREQLDRQKNALAKPAHMKAGLWIFGLITLLDILLPLVFMRIIPIYPCIEKCAENISLICMAAGLVATFIYLFCLLGWKANETVTETKE